MNCQSRPVFSYLFQLSCPTTQIWLSRPGSPLPDSFLSYSGLPNQADLSRLICQAQLYILSWLVCRIPDVLFWLSCNVVLSRLSGSNVLSWLSCTLSCSRLSCPSCPVLSCPSTFVLSSPGWPGLLSCSDYLMSAILSRMPCPSCHVLAVMFLLFCSLCSDQADLSRLTCPSCHVPIIH